MSKSWGVIFWVFWLGIVPMLHAQDFEKDGKAYSTFVKDSVYVAPAQYTAGERNWDLALGDFDLDGDLDIVSASDKDGKVVLLYNDGRGRYPKQKTFYTQKQNRGICVLDANSDNWPDVATSTRSGKLCVLINNQAGGFLDSLQVITTGHMAQDVLSVDINRDGAPDLVTAVVSDHVVNFHLNDGTGRFGEAQHVYTGHNPRSLTAGDFDYDGYMDLVVGCDNGYIYLHRGEKDAGFSEGEILKARAACWGIGIGDFNGDKRPDVAAASYDNHLLYVQINTGNGKFTYDKPSLSGHHNMDLAIADMDLDGDMDIVTCSHNDHNINYHLNLGKGKFGYGVGLPSGRRNTGIVAADLDRDGDPDIVTSSIRDHFINVHLNNIINQPPVPTVTVEGIVLSEETGLPIADAIVLIEDSAGRVVARIQTDPEGRYVHPLPMNQPYTLKADHPNHMPEEIPFYLADQPLKQDAELDRAVPFEAEVMSERTGRSIPGAMVEIRPKDAPPLYVLVSGPDGKVKGKLKPNMPYEVHTTHPNYAPKDISFTMPDRPESKEILMGRPVEIRGVVRSKRDGVPLYGAELVITDPKGKEWVRTPTGRIGNFKKTLPPGKDYTLTVSHPDFPLYKEVFDMPDNPLEKNIYLDQPSTILVKGRVFHTLTQNPIPKAQLRLLNGSGRILEKIPVDPKGSFEMELPFDESYQIAAQAEDFDDTVAVFDLLPTDYPGPKEVDVPMSPKQAWVRVTLLDRDTRDPIPDATVTITDPAGKPLLTLTTDPQGQLKTGLPPGDYVLDIQHPQYPPQKEPLKMDMRPLEKEITMVKPYRAKMRGQVVDIYNKQPLPDALVILQSPEGKPLQRVPVNDEANFELAIPFEKGYRLAVKAPAYEDTLAVFDLTLADFPEKEKMEIPLRPMQVAISGAVTDKDTGEPIPNALVSVQDPQGNERFQIPTDPLGRYQSQLPPGDYQLMVTHPEYPAFEEPLVMGETPLRKDVALQKPFIAKVKGQVVDRENGQPIPKANLLLKSPEGKILQRLPLDDEANFSVELPFEMGYQLASVAPGYLDTTVLFDLTMQDHPEKEGVEVKMEPIKALVKGEVLDEDTGTPIPEAKITFVNPKRKTTDETGVDDQGKYAIELPLGKYEQSTTAPGYFFETQEVDISDPVNPRKQPVVSDRIFVRKLAKNARFVLKNIYYDVDKATLRPESKEELRRLLAIMNAHPSMIVEISGHTDSDAPADYNIVLSEARAQSVVNFLIGEGIEPGRMVPKGYGEFLPLVPNNSAANKQLNRRTEFRVLDMGIDQVSER
ncbi:MAG: carboxypeptidase regulatory-like domain-containing protein [Bacteroidota bacterium]